MNVQLHPHKSWALPLLCCVCWVYVWQSPLILNIVVFHYHPHSCSYITVVCIQSIINEKKSVESSVGSVVANNLDLTSRNWTNPETMNVIWSCLLGIKNTINKFWWSIEVWVKTMLDVFSVAIGPLAHVTSTLFIQVLFTSVYFHIMCWTLKFLGINFFTTIKYENKNLAANASIKPKKNKNW